MNELVIQVSRRALVLGGVVVVVVVALVALIVTGTLARVTDARTVASATVVAEQQGAAERDVERAYEQAVEQVRKVRALRLAIPAADADAIETKALNDLKTLRHSAFVSLGQVLGFSTADVEPYAASVERRFEQQPASTQPSPAPVLLAPRLYAIVSRMSELSTQLSDKATTDLTAPAATPGPTPTRTPAPTASPTARP